MSVFIPPDEIFYHKSQIESPHDNTAKRSLQQLCQHFRAGRRIGNSVDRRALEVTVVGRLETTPADAKVVRWCLNLLGFIGSDTCSESVIRAASKHPDDILVVAAAVSALCAIFKNEQEPWKRISDVEPGVSALASLQHLSPDRVGNSDCIVNIERSSPAVLELALVLVGLKRAPEQIFDPKHLNADIVRILNGHDDPIVAQYSVWAANENEHLGLDALGVPLKELAAQPANVRAWLYQLVIRCAPANADLISILSEGASDKSDSVRAGAARGVAERYVDGFEPIILDWITDELSDEVLRNLERHIVTFCESVPVYRGVCLEWFRQLPEMGAGRKNMLGAASGTALYSDFKRIELSRGGDLFLDKGEKNVTINNNNINVGAAGQVTVGGNSINSGNIAVQSFSEGAEKLVALLRQLEEEMGKSSISEQQKLEIKEEIAQVQTKQTKKSLQRFLGFAEKLNDTVTNAVSSGQAWALLFNQACVLSAALLALT